MFNHILNQTYFNNTVGDYLMVLGVLIAGIIIVVFLKRYIIFRLQAMAEKTKTVIDDFILKQMGNTFNYLAYFGVFYLSLQWLALTDAIKDRVNDVGLIVITVSLIRFIIEIIHFSLEIYWLKGDANNLAKKQSLNGILTMVKIIFWGVGLVFLLDNLGFKVSSVITGLGVGGVAVALAAQAVLGDLFSYLAIFFDRPFEIGDFIIVGDFMGVVEHIGIKTTRIRSLGGEQLIFSNSDLTNSRVRNYKRMEQRRVMFKLGVTYNTPLVKVQDIPGTIKDIIEKTPDTVFDRAHFSAYGDFNLVIEIVYYVLSSDYNKYMDTQQQINFAIKKAFEEQDIEFAFPTQTVYVNQETTV
ncbi:MAG: mechanosensitive ion channel family protein [Candidatus Margulisiibacteriota bacterium]